MDQLIKDGYTVYDVAEFKSFCEQVGLSKTFEQASDRYMQLLDFFGNWQSNKIECILTKKRPSSRVICLNPSEWFDKIGHAIAIKGIAKFE